MPGTRRFSDATGPVDRLRNLRLRRGPRHAEHDVKRGHFRVLLGAAPGVGKTYEMLEEGRRLSAEGHDVVIAVVETHGRAATAAQAEGLSLIHI